jgi:hypothetical protein
VGHDTHVEVDDVHWFAGHGPADPIGPCPHDCRHSAVSVIAWGPSLRHYELVQCDDVCAGQCRAWEAATRGSNGGVPNSHPYLQVTA